MPAKHIARPLTVIIRIEDAAIAAELQSCLRELPVQIAVEHAEGPDWDLWLEQVERARPDVVLLGLDGIPGPSMIRRIRARVGAPTVIAVGTVTDPGAVLGAIRAGAAEYVYPPIAAHLVEAFERVAEGQTQQTRQIQRGKTVAFVSAKGGCGASTLACHVAASLRQQTGQATLLADFDLENGVIGFLTKTKSAYTVEDALQNADRLDVSYWKALVSEYTSGMDVICSRGAALEAASTDGTPHQAVLEFVRSQYDWVVVDFGRGLNWATQTALHAIDAIYVVTTLDVPALYRCQHMVKALIDRGVSRERVHLVVNKISRNEELTRSEIEQMLGSPVSFELPDEACRLAEAYVEGKLLPPTSDLSKRMGGLARQIAGIPEEEPKRFSFSWLTKPGASSAQQPVLAKMEASTPSR